MYLRRFSCSLFALCLASLPLVALAQSFSGTMVSIPAGTFTMGEPELSYEGPPGTYDALEHSVTLSAFQMSEAEVTNQQYVDFLNAAEAAGLVEVGVETDFQPDIGNTLVYGTTTAPAEYAGQALLNLSGTRVMKDHEDKNCDPLTDGLECDGDAFTGEIDPENPLNLTYIGYDDTQAAGARFYVKDPRDANDFDWQALTDYYNYTDVSRQLDTSVLLNDYDAWPELADYPNNLPTQADVTTWPATFVRWYGAKAFALFYGLDLPTEAEWEYAARGGATFVYATDDGAVDADGTSANWNHVEANPSLWHVEDVKRGDPNPYGLYNMAGNVWEWVEDWYASDFYTDGVTDPVNTTDTGLKVRRGGSWNYHKSTLKTAARARDEQFKGNDHFGFRVVARGGGTDVGDLGHTLPEQPFLDPNYPNPFNPATQIRFGVPEAGAVRLVVSDLLGREVAVLLEGPIPAGTHTATFEAAHLPSGLYFYQLETRTQRLTGTMVLLK